ncbi:MAG TPA: diaminopimelate epimerase [Natronosporangium sp.]
MEQMEALAFAKGHGTGNDFVILPDPDDRLVLSPKLVAALCDRRFGIGADGVLRVVRHRQPGAEWFMDYRNADGSIAETCGNGLRVFARYLVASELVATPQVVIATRAGDAVATVSDEAVSVTMTRPRVTGESTARIGGRELPGVAVDVGNPHLVCWLPPDLPLQSVDLAKPPEVDPGDFPDGVNVELITPVDGTIRMRVHERGVGETPSCGSGAVAVAAVALRTEGRSSGVVTVDVPGGRLLVSLTADDCALTGPAVLVAEGTIHLSAVR